MSAREQFEAWAVEKGYPVLLQGDLYHCRLTRRAWEAWQAALSAQPSPGGQGDSVTDEMVDAACRAYYDTAEDAVAVDHTYMEAALKAALAARQPASLTELGWVLKRATPEQVLQYLEDDPNMRACLSIYLSVEDEPVGEPVGTVHSGKYASGMPWCEVEWHIPQPAGTKLYAAPAPAVDLERFRPAVMTALGLSSPYGLERETLNGLLDLIDNYEKKS